MTAPDYTVQLADKTRYFQDLLQPFAAPAPQVFPSPPRHYRMRAEFRIWHEGDNVRYAMFERGEKAGRHSVVFVDAFPAASESINRMMPQLLAAMCEQEILRERWYQCEFLSTLSGEMLISLIYHKKLDEQWEAAARALQTRLGVFLIGRSKGQKIVLAQDFVTETLQVGGETFRYCQPEGGFTQPNARICEQMLAWACGCAADGGGGDLLELYCGNGNFTLPLARHFRQVLATEVSKTSVRAAQQNIADNGADNIRLARLSAEEFAEACSGSRVFRRLVEQGIDLADYAFSTVFVDPPRAGIDAATLKLLAGFEQIIYVSCNPQTLRDNLAILTQTHEIVRTALFDQFPFTPHIESGVWLRKRAA